MTISRWIPMGDMSNVERMMNRFLEEGSRQPVRRHEDAPQLLAMDAWETDHEVVVKAALPGFSEDDVETSIEGGQLTIRARKSAEKTEPENAHWVLRELWSGEYVRGLTLPTGLEADRAEATLEHGILTIRVPKAEASKPKQIKVGGGSAKKNAAPAAAR